PGGVEAVLVEIEGRDLARRRDTAGAEASTVRLGCTAAAGAAAEGAEDAAVARLLALVGRIAVDRRVEPGGGDAALGARFGELDGRHPDVEIVPRDALLERRQLGVAEQAPPMRINRLGDELAAHGRGLAMAAAEPGGGRIPRRLLEIRPNGAARQHQQRPKGG